MNLEIEMEDMKDIAPLDGRNIKANAYLNMEQIEQLFCNIWELIGTESLKEWIEKEGYKLVSK